jgi:excinuclease ABC subunit C
MDLKTKLKHLPAKPGVYLMKDAAGRIIYVGKAKSLRNRVRSYFRNVSPHHPKISALISKISDFEVLATDSEMEALILEANLIKQHRPRYNVNLKDDKRYPYVKVTHEPFPRVLVVRRVKKDRAQYFGPYTNVKAMRSTLKMLRKVFPIRSCNHALPSSRKIKLCLDYHIKRCLGPCEGKVSPDQYREVMNDVLLFLSGKNRLLTEQLKQRMKEHSTRAEFEKAAQVRDQLRALESAAEKQKVVDVKQPDRDIIAFARSGKDISAVALQIREGVLIGRQNFHMAGLKESADSEILSGFLRQYYMHSAAIPPEIVLPATVDDQRMIEKWLGSRRGGRAKIVVPQRGKKIKLLEMATYNAQLSLDELLLQRSEAKGRIPGAVEILQKDLYLPVPPRKIGAFDISNLGPADAVGSLVVFEDGHPKKSRYRRFRIRGVEGQDDFAMREEVVNRYFAGLVRDKMEFPDLVLIDGGKGQLSSALRALKGLGIEKQAVVALAKRIDEVFLPERYAPLMIRKGSTSLKLLQRVRNEAHRFAVEYHRKLRKKRTIGSELDSVPGVGAISRGKLLKHFGSVARIKKAGLEELLQLQGINKRAAENVYKHFHP